jgi:hypothetical protein
LRFLRKIRAIDVPDAVVRRTLRECRTGYSSIAIGKARAKRVVKKSARWRKNFAAIIEVLG